MRYFKSVFSFIMDIVQNRQLLLELTKKDLKQRYLGSYLGVLWAFIQSAETSACQSWKHHINSAVEHSLILKSHCISLRCAAKTTVLPTQTTPLAALRCAAANCAV